MLAHSIIEGDEQRKLAENRCAGRRHITETGNENQVENNVHNHAEDEGAREIVLLAYGDEHILRHAVHEANGNAPNDNAEGKIRATHVIPGVPKRRHGAGHVEILLAAHNGHQRPRQKGDSDGNRQRHQQQHAQAQHVGAQEVVALLACKAAHEREERHGEHAGDDIQPVEILEPHAVEPHADRTGQRAQNPDVNTPEDGGQQMVEHERPAHAQHVALKLAVPRPLRLEQRCPHEQPQPDNLEHIDNEAHQRQPHKAPAQQQQQRAQRHLEQRHGVGEPGRVLHLLEGVEHAAEGVGVVGKEHGKGQQRDGLHFLRTNRLDVHCAAAKEMVAQHIDLNRADVAVEEGDQRKHGHECGPQEGAHGEHIGQIGAGAVLVLGHVPREQRAQPVAAYNLKEAVE